MPPPVVACLYLLLSLCLRFGGSSIAAASGIPGIHFPLPINATVDIEDNTWLSDLYSIILGRSSDYSGYSTNLVSMQKGASRKDMYNSFITSTEFQSNPSLKDKSNFISRLYLKLLHRSPSDAEVEVLSLKLTDYDQTIAPKNKSTWLQEIDAIYYGDDFKVSNCPTGYYSFGSQVASEDTLLLHDLFDGKARFQPESESVLINLNIPSALRLWDQKLTIYPNIDGTDGYFAFTRSYIVSPNTFTVTLLKSADGINFDEVGLLWTPTNGQTFYDAHVSIDYSVCPPRYVMAMECAGTYGTASVCISYSTTPAVRESWFYPRPVVDGLTSPAESASTGVTLVDGASRYISWTQVYDGTDPNTYSDPSAHTFSQSVAVPSFYGSYYFGTVESRGVETMLSAEPHPYCTSSWDCNNRDKQDWKKEGAYFYALYNGANYYRCNSTWGLSVARSKIASGPEYTDRMPISLGILSERDDTCGTSYIVLNSIAGVPYLYYAYVDSAGANQVRRSGIVPVV